LLDARLFPIAACMKNGMPLDEFDSIGLVYPVYYADAPKIVREFCRNFSFKEDGYIYGVCNYGGGKGEAVKTVGDILKMRGYDLSASFGIQVPQNAFKKRYENREKLLRASEVMLTSISEFVKNRKTGFKSQNRMLDIVAHSLLFLIKPLVRNHLIKMSGLEKGASLEEAVCLLDNSFKADKKCTGCGICSSVCPVDNILMGSGKPEWQHRCENCLACINFCPENAIENNLADNGFRYLHPEYSLQMALKQKKEAE